MKYLTSWAADIRAVKRGITIRSGGTAGSRTASSGSFWASIFNESPSLDCREEVALEEGVVVFDGDCAGMNC